MMSMHRAIPILLLALPIALLSGCNRSAPQNRQEAPVNVAIDEGDDGAIEHQGNKVEGEADIAAKSDGSATALPAAMQGAWTSVGGNCGDRADPMRLTVRPTALAFYESEGKVLRLEPTEGNTVNATLRYTGEGESWERTQRITLSDDGQTLSIAGPTGTVSRKRCP